MLPALASHATLPCLPTRAALLAMPHCWQASLYKNVSFIQDSVHAVLESPLLQIIKATT
jgi:hypothetical protein